MVNSGATKNKLKSVKPINSMFYQIPSSRRVNNNQEALLKKAVERQQEIKKLLISPSINEEKVI